MKVLQKTSSMLVLQLRPWFLWLFGAAFSVTGLVVMVTFQQATTLVCIRQAPTRGNCELTHRAWYGTTTQAIALEDIQGAMIATRRNDSRDVYQIQLITSAGEIPVSLVYSAGFSQKSAKIRQIQSFLASQTLRSLTIREVHRWFSYAFGSIFLAVGLIVILYFGKVVTCTFDKTSGTLLLERRGPLGKNLSHFPLQSITQVEIEESQGNNSPTYRVSLVVQPKEGSACSSRCDRVPLTLYYEPGLPEKRQTADSIREFLRLDA